MSDGEIVMTIVRRAGMVEMGRPLGAWFRDPDGWWRELYTPTRTILHGRVIEEKETGGFVRCSEPLGRVVTAFDVDRAPPTPELIKNESWTPVQLCSTA